MTTTSPLALPKKALAPPKPIANGKLIATILSTYDLPNDLRPKTVILEILEQTVETGPPSARHKDRNSFKFVGGDRDSGSNELIISAPLSSLYTATAKFIVSFDDKNQGNLAAYCKISKTLRVNETQWLILNLLPEQTADATQSSETPQPNDSATSPGGNSIQPTLRLKFRLEGPYRPEISAIVSVSNAWFRTVDGFYNALASSVRTLTNDLPSKLPAAKFFLVPMVPVATISVALTPVVLGVLVVGLPFFLPFLVVILGIAASICSIGTGLYFSTSDGRDKISTVLSPAATTLLMTPAGQRFVFDTGPRPSPKSLAQIVLPTDLMGKLLISLLIDLIGSSSYLLPIVGESFDLTWAPLQAVFVAAMYDDTMPSLKYIAFVEEILPFTDIIPSATLGWARQYIPVLLDQGKIQVHDLAVAARREKMSFNQLRKN